MFLAKYQGKYKITKKKESVSTENKIKWTKLDYIGHAYEMKYY